MTLRAKTLIDCRPATQPVAGCSVSVHVTLDYTRLMAMVTTKEVEPGSSNITRRLWCAKTFLNRQQLKSWLMTLISRADVTITSLPPQ